jgi:hypothetical protein
MPDDVILDEKYFEQGIESISISSAERPIFPYKALSITLSSGVTILQMMRGRPVDLNRNERIYITFVKDSDVFRFTAIVQTIGVRGPLKLVAVPVSGLEPANWGDSEQVSCQIPATLAERVEIRGRWGNKTQLPCVIENLSLEGVLVRTPSEMFPGAMFKIRFNLPAKTVSIIAYMEVIRVQAAPSAGATAGFFTDLKFLALPDEMHQSIARYIKEAQARADQQD